MSNEEALDLFLGKFEGNGSFEAEYNAYDALKAFQESESYIPKEKVKE